MSFEFKCPKCAYLITEEDFNNNEKIMSHLNEIFRKREEEYLKQLNTKLKQQYNSELEKELTNAITKKENELSSALLEKENQLNQSKNKEILQLKEQIQTLENDKNSQKLMLDKLIAEKETELLKLNQKELDKLNEIIASQETKLANNNLELQKSLAQHETKLAHQKYEEITILRTQINELEKANQQSRIIQNKIKGENFEREVEGELRKIFEPNDIISRITIQEKKADYLQEVRQDNTIIGKIVYEVKNAEWSNNWEKKLVEDMSKQNSKYGILIATSFNSKYPNIPFKRSDYNANIYFTDSESFYFVGQILRTLIKIEYRLENNRNRTDYNEKINQFNNWKETQLPKLSKNINDSLEEINHSADLIAKHADKIKGEKTKIYKNWIKNIKDYLENFIF